MNTAARPYRMTARAEAAAATAEAVLDVAVELFTDKPYDDVSLDEVAERAGVTRRTVHRKFESKERLFVTAMDRARDEMIAWRDAAPVGDVAGAVANVVEQYERWGRNRLRLLAQEDRIAVIGEHVRGGREYHWAWVERTFAPLFSELRGQRRERRIAAVVAATDVYTWKLLRLDHGISKEETEKTLIEMIG